MARDQSKLKTESLDLIAFGALAAVSLLRLLVVDGTTIWDELGWIAAVGAFILILRYHEVLRGQEMPLGVVAFLVTVSALGGMDLEASKDFYAATAQVIPVLFLALALESRLLLRERRPAQRPQTLVMAIYFIVGEYESLRVLSEGGDHQGQFAIVVACLVAATIGLVLPAVAGQDEKARSTRGAER